MSTAKAGKATKPSDAHSPLKPLHVGAPAEDGAAGNPEVAGQKHHRGRKDAHRVKRNIGRR